MMAAFPQPLERVKTVQPKIGESRSLHLVPPRCRSQWLEGPFGSRSRTVAGIQVLEQVRSDGYLHAELCGVQVYPFEGMGRNSPCMPLPLRWLNHKLDSLFDDSKRESPKDHHCSRKLKAVRQETFVPDSKFSPKTLGPARRNFGKEKAPAVIRQQCLCLKGNDSTARGHRGLSQSHSASGAFHAMLAAGLRSTWNHGESTQPAAHNFSSKLVSCWGLRGRWPNSTFAGSVRCAETIGGPWRLEFR